MGSLAPNTPRGGPFIPAQTIFEPDIYSLEEELHYFNRPADLEQVVLQRLQLCLSRLELLETRISKLEKGLSRVQYTVARLGVVR